MKKKKIIFILLAIFLLPNIVNAKSCKVISGKGNDIGDEIACGSEHFYIIESNEETTKLLAKYNLYVGDKIDKDSETFDTATYGTANDAEYAAYLHCEELKATYGEDNVETTGKYTAEFVADEYFCRIYTPLEYNEVKQSDKAIGLYPNGNMEVVYPIYGSVYLNEDGVPNEFDANNDMIPENSQFKTYLNDYKETLTNIGVTVKNIGLIKKSGLENTINAVSNKKISIPTYNPSDDSIDPADSMWEDDPYLDYDLGISKFNIKEYVPEKYKWLYGTTYWIGSATLYKYEEWTTYFDEFLSTVGDYCSYSRGCHISKMGVGLRPVVMINTDDIEKATIVNPKTADNINLYILSGIISLIGLISSCIYAQKKYN